MIATTINIDWSLVFEIGLGIILGLLAWAILSKFL